ncbi:MAG: hypothetical protein ACSLFR_01760 [Solirubrobacteraceae bacterium]
MLEYVTVNRASMGVPAAFVHRTSTTSLLQKDGRHATAIDVIAQVESWHMFVSDPTAVRCGIPLR